MSNTVNSNKKFHTFRPIKIKKKINIHVYNVKQSNVHSNCGPAMLRDKFI